MLVVLHWKVLHAQRMNFHTWVNELIIIYWIRTCSTVSGVQSWGKLFWGAQWGGAEKNWRSLISPRQPLSVKNDSSLTNHPDFFSRGFNCYWNMFYQQTFDGRRLTSSTKHLVDFICLIKRYPDQSFSMRKSNPGRIRKYQKIGPWSMRNIRNIIYSRWVQ